MRGVAREEEKQERKSGTRGGVAREEENKMRRKCTMEE
jgi:hypothetical protein